MFDSVGKDDLIMAFFPCVRFEDQIQMYFRGEANGQKKWNDEKKLNYSMGLHQELHDFYMLISKMTMIAIKKNLNMVIENPCSSMHYLKNYWPIKPKIIDKDRMKNGDYYKKPTQFWFINCDPSQNFIFEPLEYCPPLKIEWVKNNHLDTNKTVARSLIHPQYARRFIKMYLIDQEAVA